MAYKDLLVALDAGSRCAERLSLAARLARRFGAHLVGLYVYLPNIPERSALLEPSLIELQYREASAQSDERRRATRELFDDMVRREGISAEWREAVGLPADIVALHGRYADLIVLGQLDPEDLQDLALLPRPEEVALLAGRPILVVPYAGHFEQVGRRVLVGWDASREATRAVNDALPLLADAASVGVMTVDPKPSATGHGEVPGADLALHLARHGVNASVESTVSAGIGVANTLLSRASDMEADLLVMGAYGHSRVRELLLGGVTRTILATMTLPVLMAH